MKYCCAEFKKKLGREITKENYDYGSRKWSGNYMIEAWVGGGYHEPVILSYCPFCGSKLDESKRT